MCAVEHIWVINAKQLRILILSRTAIEHFSPLSWKPVLLWCIAGSMQGAGVLHRSAEAVPPATMKDMTHSDCVTEGKGQFCSDWLQEALIFHTGFHEYFSIHEGSITEIMQVNSVSLGEISVKFDVKFGLVSSSCCCVSETFLWEYQSTLGNRKPHMLTKNTITTHTWYLTHTCAGQA